MNGERTDETLWDEGIGHVCVRLCIRNDFLEMGKQKFLELGIFLPQKKGPGFRFLSIARILKMLISRKTQNFRAVWSGATIEALL